MMMNNIDEIKAILFDLDGVLYTGQQSIAGAQKALQEISSMGIQRRFITNTSTLSRKSLHKKLTDLGFDISPEEIISAPQATLIYLKQFANPVCHLLLAEDVKRDFTEFQQSDTHADFVIIGDIGDAWSYQLMNKVFKLLMDGAELIAIHKNRFWQTEQGLQMDIGGFVTALEYASGKQATLIGKPALNFFQMALNDIGLPSNNVAIIGDDIDSDIGGGQSADLQCILVKTGKYREDYVRTSKIKPDFVIASVADLPSLLKNKSTTQSKATNQSPDSI